jgi:hypothetical protein
MCCRRIQAQHDHLEKEYRQHAIGVLRCSKNRGSGKVCTFTKRLRSLLAQSKLFIIITDVITEIKL